jgi:hypothetical protein
LQYKHILYIIAKIEMLKDIERKVAPPPDPAAETRPLIGSDASIVANLVARLRRTIRAEIAGADATNCPDLVPGPMPPSPPPGTDGTPVATTDALPIIAGL